MWTVILGVSCGWFDTRTPEEPSEGSVPWRQPTQARYVVENLQHSLEGMALDLWARCFLVEAFVFHADPALARTDPARYEGWSWEVEERVTRRLIEAVEHHWGEKDSSIVVRLPPSSGQEWLVNGVDSAMVQCRYALTVHHGSPDVDSLARGTLRWAFRRSSLDQLWYLVEWWDFGDENATAWSAIKGAFRE